MRKLLLSATLVALSFSLFAQKLDDVQQSIEKKKYDEAREKLDKFLSDPKNQNNANAYYYKGVIYNALAKDSTKAAPAGTDYNMEAFNAFKHYQELDPKNIMMTLNQNANYFQLYADYFNAALASYNSQQFDKAFYNFKNALAVEQYINSKGYKNSSIALPAFDTNLIVNTANMANKAKLEDSAVRYYQMLADAKIGGPNYEQVYQILTDYYGRKNDTANQAKYMALGKELYPNSDYFTLSELTPLENDKPKLFAKYEELLQKNPNNYTLAYGYAAELYNYLYASPSNKPADAATWESKLEPAITKAISLKSTPEANYLMTMNYLNKIYSLQDQYRASTAKTPAETKKRQGINAQIASTYDKIIPYAEAAYNAYSTKSDLKPVEKATYRNVLNVLVDAYTSKKQADKAKMYQDKLKTI